MYLPPCHVSARRRISASNQHYACMHAGKSTMRARTGACVCTHHARPGARILQATEKKKKEKWRKTKLCTSSARKRLNARRPPVSRHPPSLGQHNNGPNGCALLSPSTHECTTPLPRSCGEDERRISEGEDDTRREELRRPVTKPCRFNHKPLGGLLTFAL